MPEEGKLMPALYDHCVNVYATMREEAEVEDATTSEDEWTFIYEDHLTKLVQRLELSTPYYTSILNALKSMHCIEQLRRGGGNAKSKWRLYFPPTEEMFSALSERKKPRQGTQAALEQQVRDLTKRVQVLEVAAGVRGD